jgi:hypothetical protein
MEKFTNTPERRERMNTQQRALLDGKKDNPLFASPWMALFVLLRRELSQPRTPTKH